MSASASKHLKFGALTLLVLVMCASPALYKRAASAWQTYQDRQETEKTYDRIISACLGESRQSLPVSETTQKLMNCIHSHSKHGVNDAFWALYRTGDKGIAKRLYSQIENPEQSPPIMECSMRSKLLGHLLDRMGIKNWETVVTQGGEERPEMALWDHVVTEIQNPETGKAEIYDPTYNSYYESTGSGARLNIVDLLTLDENQIKICKADQDSCNTPEAQKALQIIRPYLGVAYRHAYDLPIEARGPLYVNPQRFDIERDYNFNGAETTFCAKAPAQCAVKRIILKTEE